MKRKYRIVAECDTNGKPFNYVIQRRFLFFWIPLFIDYAYLDDAIRAVLRLSGENKVVWPVSNGNLNEQQKQHNLTLEECYNLGPFTRIIETPRNRETT